MVDAGRGEPETAGYDCGAGGGGDDEPEDVQLVGDVAEEDLAEHLGEVEKAEEEGGFCGGDFEGGGECWD